MKRSGTVTVELGARSTPDGSPTTPAKGVPDSGTSTQMPLKNCWNSMLLAGGPQVSPPMPANETVKRVFGRSTPPDTLLVADTEASTVVPSVVRFGPVATGKVIAAVAAAGTTGRASTGAVPGL